MDPQTFIPIYRWELWVALLFPVQVSGFRSAQLLNNWIIHHLGNWKKTHTHTNKGDKRFFMTSLWITLKGFSTSQLPHGTSPKSIASRFCTHLEHALAVRSHLGGQLASTEPMRLVSFITNDWPACEKKVMYHHGKNRRVLFENELGIQATLYFSSWCRFLMDWSK